MWGVQGQTKISSTVFIIIILLILYNVFYILTDEIGGSYQYSKENIFPDNKAGQMWSTSELPLK